MTRQKKKEGKIVLHFVFKLVERFHYSKQIMMITISRIYSYQSAPILYIISSKKTLFKKMVIAYILFHSEIKQ